MNDRRRHSTAAGDWIDDPDMLPGSTPARPVDAQTSAGVQWVHSLLAGTGPGEHQRREERVARLMRRIGPPGTASTGAHPSPRPTSRRLAWRGITAAVAIAMSLLVFILLPRGATSSAAVVDRAVAAWARPVSRKYRVSIVGDGKASPRWEGELTVRGNNRFLLDLEVPVVGHVLVGSDGRSTWWLFPQGPVFVSRTDGTHHGVLPPIEAPIDSEFLRVGAVLARLNDHYEITRPQRTGSPKTVRVTARRLAGEPWRYPRRVVVDCDRRSGLVYRLVMKRERAFFLPLPHTITLEWIGHTDRSADWFRHDRHHDASRAIRYVEAR